MNKFGDLTAEEFKAKHTGLKHKNVSHKKSNHTTVRKVKDLPASFDWRPKGAVTPIKDQGACGSCWAFSAIASLEGLYFQNNQKLLSFSEQLLVDCVTAGSEGCNGGWETDGMDYAAKNGVELETDYPYKARDQKCAYNSSKSIRVNGGFGKVEAKNATALKSSVVTQPTSVAIQADQLVFQFYKTGVIKALCGDYLNHAVLAVGYDTFSGSEAFIVKNSWGTSWGNNGYVYISTDSKANKGNGVCGILGDPSFPTN